MNNQSILLFNKWAVRIVVITVLLALSIMVLCSFGYSDGNVAYAEAENPVIIVDNKTMHVGQTFEIAVNLVHNTGLEAIVLQLDYDESVFTLMKVEKANGLRTLSYTTTNINTELGYSIRPFKMLWDGRAPDTTTGTMVVFTFKAARNAEKKDYHIDVSYEEKNTKSSYGVKVPVDISGGIVTLIGGLYAVNYVDYDGAILQATEYNEEATPTFENNEPTRQETNAHIYIFNGWVPVATENSSLLVFKADYISIPKIYTVNYYLEGELYLTKEASVGENVGGLTVDSRQYFEFSGWCTDNQYKNRINSLMTMPAYNLNLYGRYVFNHRMDEIDIPVIEMVPSNHMGLIKIDVVLLSNTGIAGMILTLDYDYVNMNLMGVEKGEILPLLQFETTNTVNGYDEIPFKLYWEGIQNDYSTGIIATLYFNFVNGVDDGFYTISMTYTSGNDISYIDNESLIYTDVAIQSAILVVEDGVLQWGSDEESEPCCYRCWIIIIIILSISLLLLVAVSIYLLIRYLKLKNLAQNIPSTNKYEYVFEIIKKNSMFYFKLIKDDILLGTSKEYANKLSCVNAIFNLRKHLDIAFIIDDGADYKFEFGEVMLEINQVSKRKYNFTIRQVNNVMFESKNFRTLAECRSVIKSLKDSEIYNYIGENIDNAEYSGDCNYRFNILQSDKRYYFTVKREGVLIGTSEEYNDKNSCINAVFNLRKNLSKNAVINIDNAEFVFGFGELILQIDQSMDGKCRFSIRQENNVMFISEEFNDLAECKINIESLKSAKVFAFIKGLD